MQDGVQSHPPAGREGRRKAGVGLWSRGLKAPRRADDVHTVWILALWLGGDRRPATGCEIVAPQRDGKGNDGEPGYDDCPMLGIKPFVPLCIELDRAENCRGGDDPTAIGAPPKSQRL